MTSEAPGARRRVLPLIPDLRERVWGGQLLRAGNPPIGEAWVGFAESKIAGEAGAGSAAGSGSAAGAGAVTVGALTAADPTWMLGERLARRYGSRFPLLVKLLDCADWLSVQVHPDDEEARRMVGPDEFGKTEAWLILAASDGARILAGVRPGTNPAALEAAVRRGTILDVAAEVGVQAGDAVLVPAGMLHALGPGLLVYEVQEASDTTYRVYDWGRPAAAGRALHIEESCAVLRPIPVPQPAHIDLDAPAGAAVVDVLDSEYFDVDALVAGRQPLAADTEGSSFHLLTALEDGATIRCGGESATPSRFETILVPAGAGRYEVTAPGGPVRLVRALVP